jgi:hypothetical protein
MANRLPAFAPQRFVLPAFALLCLILIWISELYGTAFAPAMPHGSVVDPPRLSFAQRLRYDFGMPKGATMLLPVITNGKPRNIVVRALRPIPPRPAFDQWLEFFILTLSLPLAGYLGYRRPGIMVAALIVFIAAGGIEWPLLIAPLSTFPNWLFVPCAWLLSVVAAVFPVLALASFAIRLPNDESIPEKRRAVYAVDALVVAGFIAEGLGPTKFLLNVYTGLSALLVIAACLISLRYAKIYDRARVGIVFGGVMLGGVLYALAMIYASYAGVTALFLIYANISVLVVPVSLAYAILRYRVFDVAFVLNRTLVYALTSALVLVALAAMEFLSERFLSTLTHAESIAVQFLIALGVIVSVRLVHRRVDQVVDRVLFRTRHEQEAALLRFATTAQFYTAQEPLIRDTIDALVRFGRVDGAAIYLAGEAGMECMRSTFAAPRAAIDENDPAYVALRAHREEIDTYGFATAFPGARLYPMILAGRFAGVVAIGERESGESMPPDIDEAIRRIAAAVTIALAAIESDRIRQENVTLQRRLTGVQPA